MSQPLEVGPYRVLRHLGEGGMAETYVAERTGPGGFVQRVCLKRVRHGMHHDAEFVRQFQAEARIMATLQHATIVQVLDFGEDAGTHYLALELVEGMDLRQLLDAAGPLDIRTTAHLAVQLCTALDIAHRSGVVHRDVSPSNVLLSAEGEVRLTDFGIARALAETRQTRTGIVKGKYPYMAPEYVGTGELDGRSDLFGLGVLLYECLAGRRPYDGATEIETLARAATGVHVPLAEACEAVDPGPVGEALFECIERAIRPDPEQRQENAAALLEALTAQPSDGQVPRHIGQLVRTHRPPVDEVVCAPAPETAPTPGDTEPLARPTGPVTATDGTPAASATQVSGTLAAGRTARPWLWVALVGIAAGLAAGFLALKGPEQPPVAEPDEDALHPVPAAPAKPEAPAEDDTGPFKPQSPTAAQLPDASTRQLADTEREEPAPALATLTVVVIPYGDVAIDGRQHGRAPVRARLRAGKHRVVASLPGRTERRQVTLAAGGSRRLVIR